MASATVLTADRFLLTSAHVVDGADTAEAAFSDGTTIGTDVIGRDPLSDLAVLRARGVVPAPVVFGDAAKLRVAQVMPQSPAAQSGLRVGDIVLSVAGAPIASTTTLQRAMVEDAIGRRLEITVWRNGALVDVIAVPRELADA